MDRAASWIRGNLAFALLAIALTATCRIGIPETGIGTLVLRIDSAEIAESVVAEPSGARTVVPTIPALSSFTVSYTGLSSIEPRSSTATTVTEELPVGTWDIDIGGFDSGGVEVASGIAEDVSIVSGATTTIYVTLTALRTGDGTIDLTLSWTVVSVDNVTASIQLLGSATAEPVDTADLTVDIAGRTARYVAAWPAGNYYFTWSLSRGINTGATWNDAIQVYGNLTSSKIIDLEATDFTSTPPAPYGLTVSAVSGGLALAWQNDSRIALGFHIERSTDGSSWSSVADVGAEAVAYTDTTAAAGTTYQYRVSAYNAIGSSAYSAVASGSWTAAPGSVGIVITVVSPTDETITFSQSADIVVAQSSTMTIGINQAFDSYAWWLDGATVSGAASPILSLPCSGLSLGVHHLAVFVTRNGLLYSESFRFTVGN